MKIVETQCIASLHIVLTNHYNQYLADTAFQSTKSHNAAT